MLNDGNLTISGNSWGSNSRFCIATFDLLNSLSFFEFPHQYRFPLYNYLLLIDWDTCRQAFIWSIIDISLLFTNFDKALVSLVYITGFFITGRSRAIFLSKGHTFFSPKYWPSNWMKYNIVTYKILSRTRTLDLSLDLCLSTYSCNRRSRFNSAVLGDIGPRIRFLSKLWLMSFWWYGDAWFVILF